MNEQTAYPSPTEFHKAKPVRIQEDSPELRMRDRLDPRLLLESFDIYSASNELLGELNIMYVHSQSLSKNAIDPNSLLFVQVENVFINPDFRGQGYGIGLYLNFLKKIEDLHRVPVISNHAVGLTGSPYNQPSKPGSYKVWKSLVKRGLAHEIIEEDVQDDNDPVLDFISVPQLVREKPDLKELLERYYWLVTQAEVTPSMQRIIKGLQSRLFPLQDEA